MRDPDSGVNALEGQRTIDALAKAYERLAGEPLSEANRRMLSPIERLNDRHLIELNEAELVELETAINALGDLDVKKKARWLDLIRRARRLQARAKSAAVAMWTYVGRDSEKGAVFSMAHVHRQFFNVWGDDSRPHSITMAPPGHGKTTCMRGQIISELANDPSLRILILYDTDDKAKKEIAIIKQYLRSPRFAALYPEVRVLSRNDGSEDSRRRFTVTRPNWGSREPSIEGAAITSQINGNGYDQIFVDDPCPSAVVQQPATREAINFKWDNEVEQRLREPARSRIRIVCTPWHQADLAGHLIEQCRRGVREGWRIAVDQFRIEEDADGRPLSLWPERYPPSYYVGQRQRLRPNDYARLYRLVCTADEERLVGRLGYYPADTADPAWGQLSGEVREHYLQRLETIAKAEQWLSIDPSATSGRESSETAITQIAITANGTAYVTDCWFFPGNPVAVQDWIVERIRTTPIHRVLIEAQGGMTGQVALWKEYIGRRLRELGVRWTGSIIDCRTQGRGGGQNIGKRRRLQNTSAYLEQGYLKFPGRMLLRGGGIEFVSSEGENIRKLVRQILNFPSGTSDGVDTVTQWLIYNESRIQREQAPAVATPEPVYDSMRDGMKAAMAGLRRGGETKSDMVEESKWISCRF